jgi:hypothetical protein
MIMIKYADMEVESAPRDHQQQILHKLAIVVRDWQESEKQS